MSEWKLVPVDPTPEMKDAAWRTVETYGELFPYEAYCAMIAAAPAHWSGDEIDVCDAYAIENQQLSDELDRLRAAAKSVLDDYDAHETNAVSMHELRKALEK